MSTQIPLTFQQQWLFGVLQIYPEWNCVLTYGFRLFGSLNLEVLQGSLVEIMRRNAPLRTRIVVVAGIPTQQIDDLPHYYIDVESVDGDSRSEIEAETLRRASEFCDRRLDLAAGPLLTARVLRLKQDEHWLILVVHRLLVDCFAAEQLFHELWEIYFGLLRGQVPPLGPRSAEYSHYVDWQRKLYPRLLRDHVANRNRHLDSATHVRWPVDESAAPSPRGTLGKVASLFCTTLSDGLRTLAHEARTLPAMVVLAIYAAVVARWCGQNSFIIPFNIAGRHAEHQNMIGYFSHVLLLRIDVTAEDTFLEFLRRVASEFFGALAHQDFGIIAMQRPETLTGTFFQWSSYRPLEPSVSLSASAEPTALRVERFAVREFGESFTATPPGMVDVEANFVDTLDGIYASWVYRRDRFSSSTMERFLEELRAFSEQLVRDPRRQVSLA